MYSAPVLPTNMSTDHFQILQIKTCELKVNIHCHGCKEKVRKILRKIEGVYSVYINAEKQKVKVTGNVDSAILINKLAKSGKYAQLWPSENQNHEISSYMNGENYQNQIQNLISTLNTPKSQPLLTPRSLENQLPFDMRYMDMNNQGQMGWDDKSLIGDDGSKFIELDASQLNGQLNGNFYGGLQTHNDRQASMPMMNMYQPNNYSSGPMVMNSNMHNMNMQASPMFHHANRVYYY